MNIPKYMEVNFKDSVCRIELFDNEFTRVWFEAFENNKYIDKFPRMCDLQLHVCDIPPGVRAQDLEQVNNINQAIERIEEITNCKWDARAFYGMSFKDTNKIHRYFTTSLMTSLKSNVISELQRDNIKVIKSKGFLDNTDIWNILKDTWPKYNFSSDRKQELIHWLHVVNSWIHIYETHNLKQTERGFDVTSDVLNIDHDLKHIDGTVMYPTYCRTELTNDISIDLFDDANVYALKKILGKDYITCYFENDDPTEWDITNGMNIDGSFQIDYNNANHFIDNNLEYCDWLKQHNVSETAYKSLPIGKIVNGWKPKLTPVQTLFDPSTVIKESEQCVVEEAYQITNISFFENSHRAKSRT